MKINVTAFVAILGSLVIAASPAYAAADEELPEPSCGLTLQQSSGLKLGQTTRFHPGEKFLAWRATLDKTPTIYINGYPLDTQEVHLVEVSPDCFAFNLNRSVMSGDIWESIRHRGKSRMLTRVASMAFGDDQGISDDVPVQKVTVTLINIKAFTAWILFFTILLIAMIILGKKSDLLKDRRPNAAHQTYSLAKTQMAFWFFIVSLSIVFVWVITGGVEDLNTSVLMLIGISAVTFVGSTAIGSDDDSAEAAAAALEKKAQKRFVLQLLSDHEGVRLHRFQMLAWTLIFGIIFTVEVLRNLVLPEFGGTILGLMGISSGTYLGFKFPEMKT